MIFGRIKEGKIVIQRFFQAEIPKNEGKSFTLVFDEKGRTSQQNKYLWGVVYKLISDHTGFTPEEVHEVFKKRFLVYTKEYKSKVWEFTRSTTGLTINEFTKYVDSVKHYAESEMALIIPDSDIEYQE